MLLLAAACAEPRAPARSEPLAPFASQLPVYPSDLGPDSLDVRPYPAARRKDYRLYARACSQCHGLSRSLNAPPVGRAFWEFYLLGLRARRHLEDEPLSPAEQEAVLDFLEHDELARKSGPTFAARTRALAQRFEALLDARGFSGPRRIGSARRP